MKPRTVHAFTLGLVLSFAVSTLLASGSSLDTAKKAADRGDYTTAIALWSQLLADSEESERNEILIRRGEAYRALGHYQDAQQDFQLARTAARKADNRVLEAVAAQALGRVNFLQGEFTKAEPLLHASLEQARQQELSVLAAANYNMLGRIQVEKGQHDKARSSYAEALAMAQQAGDKGLVAMVHCNLARLAGGEATTMEALLSAKDAALAVAIPHEQAELLLRIAVEALDSVNSLAGQELTSDALRRVAIIAEEIDTSRLRSLSAGYLARLHEKQGRLNEALALTEKALQAAQLLAAHELSMEWEWQLGRLLRAAGDGTRAIEAFRRAAYHLEAIRHDIPITYQGGLSSFRETWAPIYLGLVDLLLAQVATVNDVKREQSLLREARDYVERIKVSELRDYLRDPCLKAKSEEVEVLSPSTAVLYPIILPNRLELLVSVGRRLYQRTTVVDSDRLADLVMLLSYRIRNQLTFQSEARKVYSWLIEPIMPLLEEHAVDTLVFVPDGPLRLLPIAALKVGQQYLVERFAIVTVPGLTLLDPRPLPKSEMRGLLAGLSRPGPVIDKLPDTILYRVMQATPQDIERSWRVIPLAVSDQQGPEPPFKSIEPEVRASEVAEKLELPGVKKEITQLSQQLEGEVLLDDEFRLERFVNEAQKNSYQVVHIASHGFFGSLSEDNFILSYDERLDMERLAGLLRPKRFAERPVELLVLSACQTAEGDDRTPLGLSGVALKSGARSALGSLWPIYDEVAQQLFPAFYRQFNEPGINKAQALQQAQMKLLGSDEFRHPNFWAAFILVGNWL
jgi:CHAT domain-containing protein/predicted negative regulator of RcsB-dependent stress response